MRATLLEVHVQLKASRLCSLPFLSSEPPFQVNSVVPIQYPNSAKIQSNGSLKAFIHSPDFAKLGG